MSEGLSLLLSSVDVHANDAVILVACQDLLQLDKPLAVAFPDRAELAEARLCECLDLEPPSIANGTPKPPPAGASPSAEMAPPDLFARQGAVVPTWRRRHGKTFGPYNSPRSCRRASSSQRKKGPPNRAVRIPTGNSVGASTVREAVSQITRNAPPKSHVAGNR